MNLNRTIEDLKRHEGFRSKPYLDTEGVITVGHGLTYLTEEESLVVVRMRLESLLSQLSRYVWFNKLDNSRREIMLNMAYNLGIDGLLGFRRMISALMKSDYRRAAEEILDSKYAKQVGRRAVELADRMETTVRI